MLLLINYNFAGEMHVNEETSTGIASHDAASHSDVGMEMGEEEIKRIQQLVKFL